MTSRTETSLSARRAWIEIQYVFAHEMSGQVALRKESVDRNFDAVQIVIIVMVALRKESVDRNNDILRNLLNRRCRSPQGERG